MKKIYHLQLTFKLVLFFGLFSASSVSFADGSKDLYPSGIQGHRAMLSSSSAAPSASFPFPNQGIHYIYVQAGEIITLASNSQDISTTKRIYLYDPDGNDVTPALGAAGNIPNRAAELAGPAKPGTTPLGDQYIPLYYTAPATGIYQVSFRGGNSHASQAGLADGNWATGTNTTYVSAWDVSVFKPSEDEFVGGRVWANVFNFAANSTSYRVYAQTYVLTKDGYIYRTSQNGMNGQLYTFFVNNNGVTDIDTKQSVYKSVSASTPAAIAALGYNIHNPNLEDTETDITHKMFYTFPASDLPTEATGAVPGGTTWLRNTPVLPDVDDLQIRGVDGTLGQVSNKGGYIGFTADAQGQYIVEIASDEIPAAFVTREIRGVASIGANEVFWDGKDGDGTPLPQGDVPATITVRMQGAEVHFPYFDVENNLDGILIERLDHSDLNTVVSDTVYWDDSEITTTSGAPIPKNNSHLPPTNSIGLRSSVNGHIFSNNYGDQKTLDTWTFIRGVAKTTSTNIVVNESDLEVVSIVSDLSDPVSVGTEWTYTSVIHNHGPSAVATNTDPDVGPIRRGAVFRLYVPDGVTISTVLSDISFSGDAGVTIVGEPIFLNGFFEAIVDMPANSGATIAVKASATSTVSTYEGTIYAWSTILRPNDYTDINATNPDISVPPTDPFFEADGIQAEYATIAGDDPTSIDLTQTNNIKLNGDLSMVADLSITKEVSAGPWQVHTPVTFTLTAVNNGPSNATGVVVTDLLPDGYLFVSGDPSLGTYDESTGEWIIGDLLVDAGSNTATLTMIAEVQPTGVYSNVATISSDVFDDDLSNNEDETGVISPEAAEADLVIEKSVDNDRPTVGTEVTFTITVTNNGPSRATDVVVNDVMANGYNVTGVTVEEGTWNAPDWTIPSLASGESSEMTITAEALASSTYDNTATVDANEDDPDESNNTDEVLVELADPSLSFVKTGVLSADGNTVTYTFTVTNIGNVTMTGVSVTDPKITGAITLDATELAPGDVATGTATYTVTQGEKDAGMVENLATVTGTPPTTNPDDPAEPIDPVPSTPDTDNPGTPGDPGIPTEVIVPADPALSFVKTGVLSADGNTVTYTFTVTNIGNVTMTGVSVTDPKITGAITLDATELAPGDVATGTATYTVTQPEKDAGVVENAATTTGTPPTTDPDDPAEPIDPVPSTPDPGNPGIPGEPGIPTEVEVPADPALSFAKTGVLSSDGNTVTYTFTVTNIGNVTMTGVSVTDPKITGAITLDATELAPGDVATGTATYTVTQPEKDAGVVENAATTTGTPPTTDPDNPSDPIDPVPSTPDTDNPGTPGDPGIPTEVIVPADPALSFVKTGVLSADGNTVTYTFTVTNIGNVTMTGVSVTDPKITGAITLDATELAPGDVATGTATYTVTQGEKDAGMVENLATATGTPPTTDPDDPAEPIDPVPSTPDPDNPGTPGNPGIPTEVDIPADPSLSFAKTGVLSAEGNTIEYTFTVTNTGNVTLTGVEITDAKLTDGVTLDVTELAPGEVAAGTATYTITQAEKDAGEVENLATATGTPPTTDPDNPATPITPVPSTPDPDNPGTPGDPGVPTEVEVPSAPSLELSKVATSEGPYAVDDYVNYEITVRNTGNVTLTDVVVTDNNAEIVSGSPIASLAPNATAMVIARHQITQADIDAGIVVNQAKVTGDDPEGNPTPEVPSDNPDTPQPNDPTVVELTQRPGLSLTKRATGEGPYAPDDYIDFEIVVRNTGNVTLKDVTVTDNNAEITDGSPIASLAPNATATVIARHQVTQADIDAGIVVNQAKVTGDDPEGDPTPEVPSDNPDTPQPNDPTVVELTQRPGLSLTKRATGEGPYAVNDYINYEIVVRNKGNVTLTDVVVTDDNAEIVSGSPIASLAPNATATVIARHQITQADIDAGIVVNQAKVTGDDPEGNPTPEAPSDNPDTSQPNDPTVVELTQQPGLVLTKRTTSEGPYEVGDYIRFEIAVTNTGNVTLANVVVTDENAEIVAGAPIASLAPNATSTVIARHQVTQADIDAGTVVNQAKVIGNDPDGNPIPEVPSDNPDTPQPNDPTVVELTNTSSLSLTKRATGEGPYVLGQFVNYEITVRNTGNVTLTDIVVADDNAELTAGTPIAVLAPNATATVIARHQITQADVDAGTVVNQAKVTGNDPEGNPMPEVPSDDPATTAPNDPTVVYMESRPDLSLTKGVTSEGPYDVGDQIKYFDIVVTNTGNVTLTDVVVTDDNAEIIAGSPIARLRPGESASVMARHVVTQADVDAGEVINQARVSGNDPGGNRTPEFLSDDPNTQELGDQTITPIAQAPAIRIDKVANRQLVEKEGDRIGYQLQVINTGNVTLYDVEITDPLTGFVQQIARVKPGVINAHTFRTTYTTTAADLVVGKIVNTATVTASAPDGSEISHGASVEVEAYFKEIEAENDDFGPVNGKTGGNAGNVFTNDKINGDPLVPGEVILTRVPSDDPSPLTLEEDGTVTIAPNTPAGTYSFDYRVCDVINPNNCSTATVTVVVAPAEIRATDDLVTGVNGYEGTSNVANVFTNDQLNGTPIGPEDVTLTLIGGDPALRLNDDGSVDVLPGTRGGTYTLEYQICEKLNPDNCSVATVTITVVNPLKIPNVFTPNGDGRNDQFEIIGIEGFDRVEVTIVNRWGNEVYRNTDYRNDWSGQGLTEGTYYYVVTTHLGSAQDVHKGWVLIKRQ